MAPALVAALGSDPETSIRTRCVANGLPANLQREVTPPGEPNSSTLRIEVTPPGEPSSVSERSAKLPVRQEKDLRTLLKKKSEEASSSSAVQAEPCNLDVQEEVTDDNSSRVTEGNLLPEPAVRFANTDRRFTAGQRGKLRDRLVVTVRLFGGQDLKKDWKTRGGTQELRQHLAQKGVSEAMIRRAITVSLRKLSQKDYDGITAVIKQIPLEHFSTTAEGGGSLGTSVNPPVVTLQSTPPLTRHSFIRRRQLSSDRTSQVT